MTCDVKLFRKRQVLAELEVGCAQPAALTAASGGIEVSVSPATEAEVTMNERDVARVSLTNLRSIPGEIKGSTKFTTEFKGSGAAATPNPLGRYLEACSMEKRNLLKITIDPTALTGDVPYGTIITVSGAPTKRAMVVVPFYLNDGGSTLFYELVPSYVGLANADALTLTPPVGAALATTAESVEAPAGETYTPISTNQKTITIRTEEDGYKKEIYGAMGSFSLSAESSGFAKLEMTFSGVISKGFVKNAAMTTSVDQFGLIKGVTSGAAAHLVRAVTAPFTGELHYVYIDGSPVFADGENLVDATGTALGAISAGPNPEYDGGFGDRPMTTGVTFPNTVPPILQDAKLILTELDGSASYKPVFSTVGVDAGNEVVVRKDGNSFNGLKAARITGRKPTASADPEMMSQADFDIFNKWFDGEPAAFQFQVGAGGDSNSLFFYAREAQFTGNSDGDRDGVAIVSSEMMLAGLASGADDEYKIVFF